MTLADQSVAAEPTALATAGADAEHEVVEQFAHLLRLQAHMLEGEGDSAYADELRSHAARSERAVGVR